MGLAAGAPSPWTGSEVRNRAGMGGECDRSQATSIKRLAYNLSEFLGLELLRLASFGAVRRGLGSVRPRERPPCSCPPNPPIFGLVRGNRHRLTRKVPAQP